MRTLDLVTLSGQQHIMNKMLLILRGEVLRLESPVSASDLATLSKVMVELEHEAGRFVPTPSVFNRHVEVAIGALGKTAIVASSLDAASGDGAKAPPISEADEPPARLAVDRQAVLATGVETPCALAHSSAQRTRRSGGTGGSAS